MSISHGLRVGPDGSIYIASCGDNRVRRVQSILTGFSAGAGNVGVPSKDGKQVYVFDTTGRHLQTVDAFTNATLYQFGYDSGGRVASVTDVNGQVTQVNHDSSGNLTSLIGPFGQQTTFTPDANGYLATATDPAGQETQFTYDANGLMLSKTNPRGGLSQYSYDSLGRLSEDQDPAGGSKTLTRSEATTGFTVTSTTDLGRMTSYQTTSQNGTLGRQNTLPNGLQSSLQFTPNAVSTVTVPDGTTTTTTEQPDPREGFGMLSPIPSVTTKTPSGITSTQTTARSVTLSGSNLATFTEQTNLNGNTWTRLFNASTSTWTTTSPAGRVSTTAVDAAERPTQVSVANVAPFTFAYDSHGRLSTTTQASRVWTQGYDSQGYLASVTDPLSHATSYINDPVGRPTQTMLADGRLLGRRLRRRQQHHADHASQRRAPRLHVHARRPSRLLRASQRKQRFAVDAVRLRPRSRAHDSDAARCGHANLRVRFGREAADHDDPAGHGDARVQPVHRAPAVVDGAER